MPSKAYTKKLVFGCGNILFGNDGFGPEVIYKIEIADTLLDSVLVMDAGTEICDLVFDLLLMPPPGISAGH